jgi:hypothetical protein
MLTSRFFWLNLIGLVVNILQYVITNNLLPQYAFLITTIIGILQIILNAIAGMVQAQTLKKAKRG